MTKSRFILLAAILLLVAGFLRTVDLSADPPVNFADRSQDLVTDGSYITYYARNEALFDSKTVIDDKVWTFIDVSLVSNVARLLFTFGPVSQISTNLAGAIPNLLGIFFFAIASIRGKNGFWLALVVLAILSVNYPLIVYGRVPLAENGLIFFSGLVTLILSRWHEQVWGLVALGVMIAAAGLFGKIFGLLLIVPALVAVYKFDQPRKLRNCSILLGSFGVGFLLILLVFYGSGNQLATFWNLGVTAHGFPDGLSSVRGFFEQLILFGYKGLFKYAPVLSLLFWISISIRLLASSSKKMLSSFELFLILWITTAWVLLSPFNYLPLRYLIFLYLPMSGFVVSFLSRLVDGEFEVGGRISRWKIGLLLLVNWLFSMHAITWPLKGVLDISGPTQAVWLLLMTAVLITAGEILLLKKKRELPSLMSSKEFVMVLVILIVGVGMIQFGLWFSSRTYTISYASQDVGMIIDEGAIIAGQDGPALCVGNKSRSYPYFLTPDISKLKDKLTELPITHIAVSKETWNSLSRKAQPLTKLPIISRFMVGTNTIYLIRVSELGLNPQASRYNRSDYEIGIDYQIKGNSDSALIYQERHLKKQPFSRASLIEKFYLYAAGGELEKCLPLTRTLLEEWPTDFSVQLMSAILFKELAGQNNDPKMLSEAKKCLELAVKAFPDNEANILNAYGKFHSHQRIIY